MHILFDGFAPRQCGKNYFENGPHIGMVYDQITRRPFYYHKEKEDTFELEEESDDEGNKNAHVRDFLGEAKRKYSKDFRNTNKDSRDIAVDNNGQIRVSNVETESNRNLIINSTEEGSNTDRSKIKQETLQFLINNQLGSDVCSPISKIKEKKHRLMISPKPDENIYKTNRGSNEFPVSGFRSSEQTSLAERHDNQMSSAVSYMNSPAAIETQFNKHITEESMNYTDKSRSEELEELDNYKQAAYKEYADHKKNLSSIKNNPFYIESKRADIDPFKEFLNNRKNLLKSSTEGDEMEKMYDEEAMFMNRISNLKEFRKLVQEYKVFGIKLNDDMSLDDDSLEDFKDGTLLCEIVSVMER